MVTIGISGNSKMLALAMFRDGELIDFKTQFFKGKWCQEKIRKMIANIQACITDYFIIHLALVIPHAHYTTREMAEFLAAIKEHCKKTNVALSTYTVSALDSLCEASKAKKKALMKAMITRYPVLTFSYQKELKNKQRYYHKLFEAVAAATLLTIDLASCDESL